MKKTMKTVGAVLCAILVLTMSVLPLCAASVPQPDVEPMWENIATLDADLLFYDGQGNASGFVSTQNQGCEINIDVYVYRLAGNGIWTYVAEGHSNQNEVVGYVNCSFIAVSGIRYRANFIFTVTQNGFDEIVKRTVYNTYIVT